MDSLSSINYWSQEADKKFAHSAQAVLRRVDPSSKNEGCVSSCGPGSCSSDSCTSCGVGSCNCGGGCNGECATG